MNTRTKNFQNKLKEEKNGKRREKKKAESWEKIAFHAEEISRPPYNIVADMGEKKTYLGGKITIFKIPKWNKQNNCTRY